MRLPIFLIAALTGALPFLAIPLMMALSDAGHVEAWRIVSGTVVVIWTPLWLLIGALASAWASPATKQSQYADAAPQAEPQPEREPLSGEQIDLIRRALLDTAQDPCDFEQVDPIIERILAGIGTKGGDTK